MFNKHILNSMIRVLVLVVGAILVVLSSHMALAQPISDGFEMRANNAVPTTRELADSMIYLPLVVKNFRLVPAAPVLSAISNADGDGNYSVSWSSSEGADTYSLEEDDNASFSSPSTVYSGSGPSTNISGRNVGTYYYRAQATNSFASSTWSNIESVTVTVPPPACPQIVAWRGTTNQGRSISFEVDNKPQCQIAADSLEINFLSGCNTSKTTIFTYDIPVTSSHFDTGGGNITRVIGDFTTPVTASGTFSYSPGTSCDVSGTWTAEPNLGANDTVYALAIQADGKILVGGDFTTLGGYRRSNIGRLNADGSLDTSFNPGADDRVRALAVQLDGKIVVGGDFKNMAGQTRYFISRLNSDGSLDTGFNPGNSGLFWRVNALAIQTDGKIVVGGSFDKMGGATRENIARLNASGSIDTTFNPGAGSIVYALALQGDGKILVGVSAYLNLSMKSPIERLNTDGSLDSTFNADASGASHSTYVYSLIVQDDGKILVAGEYSKLDGVERDALGRLNSDGSLDTSFDTNFDTGSSYYTRYTLALQTDDKILVGGGSTAWSGSLGRLNSDGTVDATFGPGAGSTVYALALQANGKILVGGSFTTLGGETRYHIGRLNADGTLDAPPP